MSDSELVKFAFMIVPLIDFIKSNDEFGDFEQYLEENFTPEFVRDFHENKSYLEQIILEIYEKKEGKKKEDMHYQ